MRRRRYCAKSGQILENPIHRALDVARINRHVFQQPHEKSQESVVRLEVRCCSSARGLGVPRGRHNEPEKICVRVPAVVQRHKIFGIFRQSPHRDAGVGESALKNHFGVFVIFTKTVAAKYSAAHLMKPKFWWSKWCNIVIMRFTSSASTQ